MSAKYEMRGKVLNRGDFTMNKESIQPPEFIPAAETDVVQRETAPRSELVRPAVKSGQISPILDMSRATQASLVKFRDFLKKNRISNPDLLSANMNQIKELQVLETETLNVLSECRRLVANDLNEVRRRQAALRKGQTKS